MDPGLTGAISALAYNGDVLLCEDLPIIADGKLRWVDSDALLSMLLALPRNGHELHAVVERQSSRPLQSSQSGFTSGALFGSLLATIIIARASLEMVTAGVWKRALGLSDDKNASLDKARLMFPAAPITRKKHDGRAESLLIAHWHLHRRKMADFMRPISEVRE